MLEVDSSGHRDYCLRRVMPLEAVRLLVQNLIIIAVLAVFLEMLLPASQLRSYVKMVMGLLIIVAVLQTLGNIAGRDWLAELPELGGPPGAREAKINDIMAEGKKINRQNEEKALEEYRNGIARQVTALAGLDGRVSLISADVMVQEDSSAGDFGQVKEIRLVVGRPGEGGSGSMGVRPVQPVMVGQPREGENTGRGDVPGELRPALDKLSSTVANFYNIPAERVTVIYRSNERGGQ